MRTTVELIDELDVESKNFFVVGLAVGFKHTTVFVFSYEGDRPEKLEKLNNAVQAGGEPIGMVGVVKDEDRKTLTFFARPLAEYCGEQWAKDYLHRLTGMVQNLVAAAKGLRLGELEDVAGYEWVN